MTICGVGSGVPGLADESEDSEAVPCCMGSAMNGPSGCTCWTPEYDLEQTTPLLVHDATEVRSKMCEDCAFRAGSPEMADDFDREHLRSLNTSEVFYCHQGIRRPALWVHPRGWKLAADPAGYAPLIEGNRPFRADGRPAAVCAGYAAMHRLAATGGS